MTGIMLDSEFDLGRFLLENYGKPALGFLENLILAVVVFVVGWKLVGYAVRMLRRAVEKHKFDITLEKFVISLVSALLRIFLVVQCLGILGIESASLVTLLGGSTLVVGLGLQGSLANFAGGVMILLQKTFQVGDYISDGTHEGTVESINIISTRIRTPDNKLITLQNGALSNAAVINYSAYNERRLAFNFSISYNADMELAKKGILNVMRQDARVLQEKDMAVLVKNHGDSAIELFAYCWVKREDYFRTGSDIRERVKMVFDEEGISIPYPQMDVHLIKEKKE